MRNKSTFIILLDAFRHDYISQEFTPFLFKTALKGYYIKKIKPSFGFCERTEFFTGLKPNESGYFSAIGFNPKNSQYKNKTLLNFLSFTENLFSDKVFITIKGNKYSLKFLFRKIIVKFIFKSKKLNPYLIPYKFLKYFSLTEDAFDHFSPNAFKSDSLYDFFLRNNLSVSNNSYTSLSSKSFKNDLERLNNVTERFKKNQKDIYFIYISSPDKYGHLYGPNSSLLKEELFKMDTELESFKNNVNQHQENNFIYIGDHGMIEVKHEIDCGSILLRILIKQGLLPDKDFIYFLDSTMFRIWFLNKAEPNIKLDIVNNDSFLTHGFFPNEDFLIENNLPIDRKYGDILWIANPGVLVFPDFFNSSPAKGMHGYDPNMNESKGLFISNGPNIVPETYEEKDLSSLFSIQKKLIKKFYLIN